MGVVLFAQGAADLIECHVRLIYCPNLVIGRHRRSVIEQAAVIFRNDNAVDHQKYRCKVEDLNAGIARGSKGARSLQEVGPHINGPGLCPDRLHMHGHDILLVPAAVKVIQCKGFSVGPFGQAVIFTSTGRVHFYDWTV